jgi:hypothetical protein
MHYIKYALLRAEKPVTHASQISIIHREITKVPSPMGIICEKWEESVTHSIEEIVIAVVVVFSL